MASARARSIGLSQTDIAEAVGASQSQVSRVLSGSGRRRSRIFDEVCRYVFSIRVSGEPKARRASPELDQAVAAVWDGTAEHAQALALVIRSLGGLRRTADPGSGMAERHIGSRRRERA